MIIFPGINDQSRYEKMSDYSPMDLCLSATLPGDTNLLNAKDYRSTIPQIGMNFLPPKKSLSVIVC